MLTLVEKSLFVLLGLGAAYFVYNHAARIIKIIKRGTGSLATDNLVKRAIDASIIAISQRTVLKRRPLASGGGVVAPDGSEVTVKSRFFR